MGWSAEFKAPRPLAEKWAQQPLRDPLLLLGCPLCFHCCPQAGEIKRT